MTNPLFYLSTDERALAALTPEERLLLHGMLVKMQNAIRLALKEGDIIETNATVTGARLSYQDPGYPMRH
jgi:hypothetical protein